tara:strand:+ start:428 stop:604 length:177 start_codon:yes stop_codon:yes gene_type:complete
MKNEYPKKIRIGYFKDNDDTRNSFLERYAITEVVNNQIEEELFYNSINHEANTIVDIL